MSPRSEELWESARDRLALAALALSGGHEEGALSAAYYAMLYAVRAALSEEDRHAKTHSGTWHLFREVFVVAGRFDEDLFEAAHALRPRREAADYDAERIPGGEAAESVALRNDSSPPWDTCWVRNSILRWVSLIADPGARDRGIVV